MPIRPRRGRQSAHALSMQADVDLVIGPRDDDDLAALEAIFNEHRWRYGDTSWAVQYWIHGSDKRDPTPERQAEQDAIRAVEAKPRSKRGKWENKDAVGLPHP
jgi:hypothetical protein